MVRRQFARITRGAAAGVFLGLAAVGLCLSPWAARAATDGHEGTAVRLPLRTWENYFGVAILPSGRAIVVGDKGILMSSDDKGQTWSRQQLMKGPTGYDLYSVAFTPDGKQAWAVGDGGAIFHSSDGGGTWTLQQNKVVAALLKVATADNQTACAVGEHGTVLCTSDAGSSWNLLKIEDMVFFDVAFTDSHNGWVVGEFGTLLHSGDGGKTWAVQLGGKRSFSADPYFALAFTDASNGMAFGLNGADLVTTDGGKNWKPGTTPGSSHSIFSAVSIPARPGALYLGGADGSLGPVNQGQMVPIVGATPNSITGLAMSPSFGLAVGMSGTLLRTEDGGQHWDSATTGVMTRVQAQAE